MKLYSYWRSSTFYRVWIALNLKRVPYETVPVDLRTGEQGSRRHQDLNPGRGVPVLVTGEGDVLTPSMAILEWLEETYPSPALLPAGVLARARVRAAAMRIASDIHPVNNLRVIARLNVMGHGRDEVVAWVVRWMQEGLAAFQSLIDRDSAFCFGDAPGLADLCLVPQMYNAHRWGCDLGPFARLSEIETRCLALPAFGAARPERQADAST